MKLYKHKQKFGWIVLEFLNKRTGHGNMAFSFSQELQGVL